ncbi:MAG: hypothetical protein AAF467_22880 [Actinomycetota bacterium]
MGSDAALRSACELAYAVARGDAEADPPVDAPRPMRSYLYVPELPERALRVARDAIEDDPAFRRRVAAVADENEIGRAGYLWLHRPIGWAAEFEQLSEAFTAGPPAAARPTQNAGRGATKVAGLLGFDAGSDAATQADTDTAARETAKQPARGRRNRDQAPAEVTPVESVPAVGANAVADSEEGPTARADGAPPRGRVRNTPVDTGPVPGPGPGPSPSTGAKEAVSIEDELSSLRGLVNRLSNERKAVATSVDRTERQVESARKQPSAFEGDIYTLRSELESARSELDEARRERDSAVQQHSASLTRQLKLEKELDQSRELRAEVEREHSEVDTELVSLRETLARTEASSVPVVKERDRLAGEVDTLTTLNDDLAAEITRLAEAKNAEVEQLGSRTADLETELNTLRSDRTDLTGRLADAEQDLEAKTVRLDALTAEAEEQQALSEALTDEKMDLATRLADTESMLETTRAQLSAVRADADAVAADISAIKSHRDGLATQVDELHGSLAEALDDLARVRSNSDSDRAALKEVRGERDELKVEFSALQETSSATADMVASLEAERAEFAAEIETLQASIAEAGQLRREAERAKVDAEKTSARLESQVSALEERAEELDGQVSDLKAAVQAAETALTNQSQQAEQLRAENVALQEQLVESDRMRIETTESQGNALSELAGRLALVENERNDFETQLSDVAGRLNETEFELNEAKGQLDEAKGHLDEAASARDDAEDRRRKADSARRKAEKKLGEKSNDAEAKARVAGLEAEVEALKAELDAATAAVSASPGVEESTDDDAVAEVAADVEADVADVEVEDEADDVEIDDIAAEDEVDDESDADAEDDESGHAAAEVNDQPEFDSSDDADATRVVPSLVDDLGAAVDDESESRTTKRHAWSLGALRRNGRTGRQPEQDDVDVDVDADAENEVPPPPEDDFDRLTAAMAEGAAPADEAVADEYDDLDSISNELANALGSGSAGDVDDDEEDLDEISNLISQTVTDFSPGAAPSNSAAADSGPGFDGGFDLPHDELPVSGPATGSMPPSVFTDREVDELADELSAAASGAPSGGASGRRQIVVPDKFRNDEVEMARYVVSSPDVVLLVDGDAVAKMGWPSLPVAQQRDALVSYLADLSATSGAAPDVVFDGRIGEEDALPASRAVRIRLSTPPTEPAAALDELVDAYPVQWPIVVITDDEMLGTSARERGATTLSNGQLLDLFISQ